MTLSKKQDVKSQRWAASNQMVFTLEERTFSLEVFEVWQSFL